MLKKCLRTSFVLSALLMATLLATPVSAQNPLQPQATNDTGCSGQLCGSALQSTDSAQDQSANAMQPAQSLPNNQQQAIVAENADQSAQPSGIDIVIFSIAVVAVLVSLATLAFLWRSWNWVSEKELP